MQNVWNNLSFKMITQSSSIVIGHSLASEFSSTNHNKSEDDISLRIEESLESEVGNCIDFANVILKNEKKLKGEPRVYYILRKYKKKGSYDILTSISENVTLIQLMD